MHIYFFASLLDADLWMKRINTSHAKKVIMLATTIGSLKSMAAITPAIIGGIYIPRAVIDWLIPRISPCESLLLRLEIIASALG